MDRVISDDSSENDEMRSYIVCLRYYIGNIIPRKNINKRLNLLSAQNRTIYSVLVNGYIYIYILAICPIRCSDKVTRYDAIFSVFDETAAHTDRSSLVNKCNLYITTYNKSAEHRNSYITVIGCINVVTKPL